MSENPETAVLTRWEVCSTRLQPTYFVKHPNDSYGVADPQPIDGPVLTEMVERAVSEEREKWAKLYHAGSGVTLDFSEILKESVDRATAPLIAELDRIKSGRPPEHGPLTEDEVEHRVERATTELRAENSLLKVEIDVGCHELLGHAHLEIASLKAQLAEAVDGLRGLALYSNHSFECPVSEMVEGCTESTRCDCGLQKRLDKATATLAALSAPAKEGEKCRRCYWNACEKSQVD